MFSFHLLQNGRVERSWEDNSTLWEWSCAWEVGRWYGVPESTARRWLRHYNVHGEVAKHPNPGRPSTSSRKQEDVLYRAVQNYPFRTSELKAVSGFPLSTKTVKKPLRSRGIRSFCALRKESISEKQAVDRIAWLFSKPNQLYASKTKSCYSSQWHVTKY